MTEQRKRRNATRCPACGAAGTISKQTGAGRFVESRGVRVELPDDLALTQCSNCRELWLDDAEADAYSEAVDNAFEKEMARRARAALGVLERVITQTHLEELLHVSHGYLSKVRNEAKAPSPTLVGQLALLAADPKRRLEELERYWRTGSADAR